MLACEPEVILMDEPFSALDEYLREQMQDELIQYAGNVGQTSDLSQPQQ